MCYLFIIGECLGRHTSHFSLFLVMIVPMIFLKTVFPAVQAFVLVLLSLGLSIMCRKSIGSAQKAYFSFQGQLGNFYSIRNSCTLQSVRGIHFSVSDRGPEVIERLSYLMLAKFLSLMSPWILDVSTLCKHNFHLQWRSEGVHC